MERGGEEEEKPVVYCAAVLCCRAEGREGEGKDASKHAGMEEEGEKQPPSLSPTLSLLFSSH